MNFRTGYDIGSDLHHGFTLKLGRLLIAFHYNAPQIIWYNRNWAVDEDGYLPGMAVKRHKPKRWRLRSICFPRQFQMRWL